MQVADKAFFAQAPNGIYICATRISVPLHFFIHTYVVTVLDFEVNRYEVYREYGVDHSNGYIYKNLQPAWMGSHVFAKATANEPGRRFICTLLQRYTDEIELLELIQKTDRIHLDYPYRCNYRYVAPNSNTYTQWLIDALGLDYRLPFIAWGRGFVGRHE